MTDPLTAAVIAGLTGLVTDLVKEKGGKLLKKADIDLIKPDLEKALQQYIQKYRDRYGSLKLLGMPQAVPLESVYTAVRFLDGLSIRQFESQEAMEEAYRKRNKRQFQMRQAGNQDGIDVANDEPRLMVLGGPGAGKSTFLRRLGLEALKGKEGRFKHSCIPVFLELKRFLQFSIDIKKAIIEEFQNFNFPQSEELVNKALEQGKFLILLDGLDEVPQKRLTKVIDAIEKFTSRYDKNRFVASCRVARYRSSFISFVNFRDIELADFDNEQIQNFIDNWFQSELDKQSETSERCWRDLTDRSNKAAKELAQSPLLLTFLCLVYNHTQNFPTKRSALYRKALDILLEEWAAEKRIMPGEIYQGINTELEKVLLAEIAYQGFVRNQLFFEEQELIDEIKGFLVDTVDKPKDLEGKPILDEIAIQQGILVERVEGVFSFSHLTLQEYLTAQYIFDEYKIRELVTEHLIEERWREVFLLVAGLMRNADALLELMETASQKFIKNPKLQTLLSWLNWATAEIDGSIEPVTRRAATLHFLLAGTFHLTATLSGSRKLASDHAYDLMRSLNSDLARDCNRALNLAFTRASDRDRDRDRDQNMSNSFTYDLETVKILKVVNFKGLIDRLQARQVNAPNTDQPLEVRKSFTREIRLIWFNSLQVRYELVNLSEEEAIGLRNYLYVNELMLRCKEAAVRVSREKWEAIEARMLTAPAE